MALLFFVFAGCFAAQAAYAVFLFLKSYRTIHAVTAENPEGVSIIICARNEAGNLALNLPAVLAQKYGFEQEQGFAAAPWEVIVVDDGSADNTQQVLSALGPQPRLTTVTLEAESPRALPGKKHAMQQGVAAAKYPWILTTDADCEPLSDMWLGRMTAPLAGHDVVIGFGRLDGRRSLLSAYIQGETLFAFIQSAAFAAAGMPSSATGRNLAFRKSFYEAQKSATFSAVPSGDDDLLLHGPVRPNVAVVKDFSAQTISPAKAHLTEYFSQKRRHASTGKYYRPAVKAALGGYGLSQAVFWLAALLLIIAGSGMYPCLAVAGILLRWLMFSASWNHNSFALGLRRTPLFLFFDLCWLMFNTVLAPYILWKNKQTWS